MKSVKKKVEDTKREEYQRVHTVRHSIPDHVKFVCSVKGSQKGTSLYHRKTVVSKDCNV